MPLPNDERLLAAALPHVPFDGWSPATFRLAAEEAGLSMDAARTACPGGGPGLALLLHRQGDRRLAEWLKDRDWGDMRFRDRIAAALMQRLDIAGENKEAVRRAAALFALPNQAAAGAGAIWHTADMIWTGLGDDTRDFAWMTKRLTLAAVWSASFLFWLGDETPDQEATRDFVDRRIGEVMRFEGLKARWRGTKAADGLAGAARRLWPADRPLRAAPDDFPGKWP